MCGVFQARYGFSNVSSVSLVGSRPVGMGIDIVTTTILYHLIVSNTMGCRNLILRDLQLYQAHRY